MRAASSASHGGAGCVFGNEEDQADGVGNGGFGLK